MAKLENYGERGVINSCFRSHLSDRRQSIEIDKSKSKTETILSGVPQGSTLGRLLFLLYIFLTSINLQRNFLFYLFANDTSLTYANDDLPTQ